MRNFWMIFCHYIKRFFRDWKEVLLLLIIPIGLMIFYSFFDTPEVPGGYNLQSSFALPIMMIGFQFFNGSMLIHYLYPDVRGDMSWRLRAAPHTMMSFVLPAFFANWLFSIILGVILVIVGVTFLGAYVGSYLVLGVVLIITSMIATLTFMIVFMLTKKLKVANALVYIISFGHFILSGALLVPLGDNAIARFLMSYGTPISLGTRAITYSGQFRDFMMGGIPARVNQDWFNIGILFAIMIVFTIITILIGRKKKA